MAGHLTLEVSNTFGKNTVPWSKNHTGRGGRTRGEGRFRPTSVWFQTYSMHPTRKRKACRVCHSSPCHVQPDLYNITLKLTQTTSRYFGSWTRIFLFLVGLQGAVVLVQAAASRQCRLQQLQMHNCGIADTALIQKAIQLRAAEALENAKPKKKAKKKKKAAMGKEAAAGRRSGHGVCAFEIRTLHAPAQRLFTTCQPVLLDCLNNTVQCKTICQDHSPWQECMSLLAAHHLVFEDF